MKKIILFAIIAFTATIVNAQYKPSEQGSSLTFEFNIDGSFKGLQGDIKFDPQNPAASLFDVSIDAATVNTDNGLRDNHLRGDTYFDVKNYPRIHFVSTKVIAKNGTFNITGNLTIKKKTKSIAFPFTAVASNDGYQFKGSFTINRKDFDVGGSSTIADNLDVSLNILVKKN
jgi:polyisoprenoid-binding protein YceI